MNGDRDDELAYLANFKEKRAELLRTIQDLAPGDVFIFIAGPSTQNEGGSMVVHARNNAEAVGALELAKNAYMRVVVSETDPRASD